MASRQDRATYAEARSIGEAKALRADEHLCDRCLHAEVCEIAAAVERHEEALPAISRCAAFIAVPGGGVLADADGAG